MNKLVSDLVSLSQASAHDISNLKNEISFLKRGILSSLKHDTTLKNELSSLTEKILFSLKQDITLHNEISSLKQSILSFESKNICLQNYDISWIVNGRTWYASYQSYDEYMSDYNMKEYMKKLQVLACDLPNNIKVYCEVCGKISIMNPSHFHGVNESYGCGCSGMNSRMRAVFEFILNNFMDKKKVYIQEKVTPSYYVYEMLFGFDNIVGSEYLGEDKISGESYDYKGHKIMHQDCTKMSFDDNTFDLIISQDVLEHIFDTRKCLSELYRVTKPNGACIIMVPFLYQQKKSEMLARLMEDGAVEYIVNPPVMHGNPVGGSGGILTYWDHGWEFIDIMKEAGFRNTTVHFYNNVYKGHFGVQSVITGTK